MSLGAQRRKHDFEGHWESASTFHAFPSWFYSVQASSLPWRGSGSMFQVLKMGTYRLDVLCPTSEATVWSWSGWTVVPFTSVYNKFFVLTLACFSCPFSPSITHFPTCPWGDLLCVSSLDLVRSSGSTKEWFPCF